MPLTTFIKINNRNFVKSFDLINLLSHWSRSTWENAYNHGRKIIKKILEGIVIHLKLLFLTLHGNSITLTSFASGTQPAKELYSLHERCVNAIQTISLHERCLHIYFSTKLTEQNLVKLNLTNSFAVYTGVYRSWQA